MSAGLRPDQLGLTGRVRDMAREDACARGDRDDDERDHDPEPHSFRIPLALADMDKQIYLRRLNCEYREFFANLLKERGLALRVSYQTEREDWIQSLVAGGLASAFCLSSRRVSAGCERGR
jgi:hypothetical protein